MGRRSPWRALAQMSVQVQERGAAGCSVRLCAENANPPLQSSSRVDEVDMGKGASATKCEREEGREGREDGDGWAGGRGGGKELKLTRLQGCASELWRPTLTRATLR